MVIFIRAQWCGERGWKSRCAKKILTIDGRPCHFFLYVVKCVKWSFLRDSSLFKKNSVVFHAATSHVNFWKSFFFLKKKNISHFIGNTPSYMEHTHEFTQNLTNAFAKSRRPSILVNWIFIFHSFQSASIKFCYQSPPPLPLHCPFVSSQPEMLDFPVSNFSF